MQAALGVTHTVRERGCFYGILAHQWLLRLEMPILLLPLVHVTAEVGSYSVQSHEPCAAWPLTTAAVPLPTKLHSPQVQGERPPLPPHPVEV